MIFDCFTFFNEHEVARMRVRELSDVVDQFVIIEAKQTFRGNPKPVNFDSSFWRPEIRDKMNHFVLDELPGNIPWDREIFQRNYIKNALEQLGAGPEDTVIISDVDEIPRASTVREVVQEHRLVLDKFSYGINMLTDEGNDVVRILPYGHFGDRTVEQIRRGPFGELIPNAGWEFSSLGTPAQVMNKFMAFSHSEFDHVISEEIFAERMSQGIDLLGRNITHTVVDIDDTWPRAVVENREYWSKYEWSQ